MSTPVRDSVVWRLCARNCARACAAQRALRTACGTKWMRSAGSEAAAASADEDDALAERQRAGRNRRLDRRGHEPAEQRGECGPEHGQHAVVVALARHGDENLAGCLRLGAADRFGDRLVLLRRDARGHHLPDAPPPPNEPPPPEKPPPEEPPEERPLLLPPPNTIGPLPP